MARRMKTTLNASGMADIAFLLLIFFLVATTFMNEKGVKATLPIYYEGPPGKMPDNQVINIKINMKDQVMLEGRIIDLENVEKEIKSFILNPNNPDGFSSKAVISLQHDLKTSYSAYLSVYGSIKNAYKQMRNQASQELFNQDYDELSVKDRNVIIKKLPIKLSESDPYIANS